MYTDDEICDQGKQEERENLQEDVKNSIADKWNAE